MPFRESKALVFERTLYDEARGNDLHVIVLSVYDIREQLTRSPGLLTSEEGIDLFGVGKTTRFVKTNKKNGSPICYT